MVDIQHIQQKMSNIIPITNSYFIPVLDYSIKTQELSLWFEELFDDKR
jgi:hypothetical protein